MPVNKQERDHDNRERGSLSNSSTDSVSGDNSPASSGPGPDNSGPQNPGQMGSESTGHTEGAGGTRFPGAVLGADEPAESGSRRADGPSGSGNQRTGATGAEGDRYSPGNFRLASLADLGAGGAKSKYKDNIAALALLQQLDTDKRQANSAEQAILARYVGWGGIPQVFDTTNTDWEKEYARLSELLTADEYEAARSSTLNAHYTSGEVIDGLYSGLKRLGVSDGVRILEPASGIGHFAGKLPFSAEMTLNELDVVSARISRHLYPEFTTINQGFEKFRSPNGYFDVAIGNPPFGNFRINDPHNPQISRFSIHNFFIAKSVDSLRAGGITAMVVSRFFMDAKNNEHREYLADRAHFLGAIRLPENAFRQNALTTVTTDIVFFQKAMPGEEPDRSWTETGFVRCDKSGESIEINSWFVNHPEQIIGSMQMVSRPFGPAPSCVAPADIVMTDEINRRLNVLPRNCFNPAQREQLADMSENKPPVSFDGTSIKVDSFFITPDNRIGIRKPDLLGNGDYDYVDTRSSAEDERIRSAIEIRDTLVKLIELETQEEPDENLMNEVRGQLNKYYDRHVKKYDFLSSRTNKSVLKYDPLYPLLQSLEVGYDRGVTKTMAAKEGTVPRKPSARKAAIFSRRVNRPNTIASHAANAKDGLVISLNETGRVDINRIAALTSLEPSVVTRELQGLIYRNPKTLEYETSDAFLSGNVKKKLLLASQLCEELRLLQPDKVTDFTHRWFTPEAAEIFSAADKDSLLDELLISTAALEKIQPADIDAIDISVQLISSWLPQKDIQAFIREHLGIADQECKAIYVPPAGKWVTSFKGGNEDLLKNTWGTERMSALEILDRLYSNAPIQVKDVTGLKDDGTPIYTVNQEETLAAQGKAEQIANEFADWIWKDPNRRERLARIYNDRFNTHVPATYDGSHLVLPQASGDMKLRGTQKNAIWRGIQEGCGLGDHAVGAGKTLTAIATIMEQRRMGLISKPLVTVPNHLLGQWKDEFYKLYPGANVLVAEQADFEKDNRKRLFATIATGDFDAVIIGHSSFKFLSLAPEDELAFLKEQVNDISASLDEFRQSLGRRDPSIKEMEKQKKRLEEKISKISASGKKDDLLTFDQLGVDALFVDEADEFKNLAIVTSQTRIAGLGNLQGSEKAMDLFLKCRWLQKKHGGKGVYFYTGTPISNSLAELYTLQRYMQYDELKEKNIAAFDSWSSTFGQVVTGWELDATGVNYRLNARFSKFTNVPELMRMYRSFADVVTHEDLAAQARADGSGRLVPKLKGGKPTSVIVPRSERQARFMGEMETVIDPETNRPQLDNLGREIKEWTPGSIIFRMENMPKDPRIDNALKVTHDARIAALDFRLVDPHAPDDEGSKVNEAVRRIFIIWEANTYRKGTQLVFCDLSTPKGRFTASKPTPSDNQDQENESDDSFSMDEILGESIDPDKFSVYADIRQKLIDKGVPANEIRFIHDATNDQKRQELFRSVNDGDVRVLIGSTSKMGAGTNVQRRLVALHDLDCPWRPRDLEQRHGRILRQGNMFFEQDKENFEVELLCYATERTYDARMWQTIEVKARGIEQFRNGTLTDRVIEDIAGDAANAAEMKASATGNQLIFQQVKIDSEKRKQETLYRNWQRSRHSLEERVAKLPPEIRYQEERLPAIRDDVAYIQQHKDKAGLTTSAMTFHWRKSEGITLPENAVEQLETYLKDRMRHALDSMAHGNREPVLIGNYRGMQLTVEAGNNAQGLYTRFNVDRDDGQSLSIRSLSTQYSSSDSFSPTGLFTRIDNKLSDCVNAESGVLKTIEGLEKDLAIAKSALEGDYPQKAYLDALRQDSIEVMAELKRMQDDDDYKSSWTPSSEAFEVTATAQTSVASDSAPEQGELIEYESAAEDDEPELMVDNAIHDQDDHNSLIPEADLIPDSTEVKTAGITPTEQSQSAARPEPEPENSVPYEAVEASEKASVISGGESADDGFLTIPFKYGSVIYNTGNDRLQVSFDEKPEKGSNAYRVMLLLKQQARFSFAPSQEKRWVRKLNDKAAIAAAGVLQTELPLPSTLAPAEQHSEPALTPHQHKDGESDLFGQHQLASEAPERLLSYDEILELEVTANELFSRHQEGECPDSTLYSAVSQLADTGSPEGKYLLAFCYFDGIGVKADSVRATELMHEAAAKGHSEASYKVGEMFETGEHGHVVDLKQAAHFYGKADPEFSKPARERVERLLGAVRPSVMSGFREILDQHKQQAESEAKFFSRMNLLYQRMIECQATLDCLKADLDIIDSSSPAIVTDRGAYLPGELQPDQMTELNRSLMDTIRETVALRKATGKAAELSAGSYCGLQLNVRSKEDELSFTLTGKSVWMPAELIYRKGEKEKFSLADFVEALGNFRQGLQEDFNHADVMLQQLEEQIRSEKASFLVSQTSARPDTRPEREPKEQTPLTDIQHSRPRLH